MKGEWKLINKDIPPHRIVWFGGVKDGEPLVHLQIHANEIPPSWATHWQHVQYPEIDIPELAEVQS